MAAVIDPGIPELMTVADVADMRDTTRQAVLKLITTGTLPARQVGHAWVIRREVAEALNTKKSGYEKTDNDPRTLDA